MSKDDIVRKLTSRKFWATIADFVGMLIIALGAAQETAAQVAAIIMAGGAVIAYIVGEGMADAAGASPSPVYHAAGDLYLNGKKISVDQPPAEIDAEG